MPQLKSIHDNATPLQKRVWSFLTEQGWTYERGAKELGFSSKQGLHQWLLKEFKRPSPVDGRVEKLLNQMAGPDPLDELE